MEYPARTAVIRRLVRPLGRSASTMAAMAATYQTMSAGQTAWLARANNAKNCSAVEDGAGKLMACSFRVAGERQYPGRHCRTAGLPATLSSVNARQMTYAIAREDSGATTHSPGVYRGLLRPQPAPPT